MDMDRHDAVDRIMEAIHSRLSEIEHMLVAIDGRCAAGKTTLAEHLQKETGCAVFHMDDFFLRPWQRTAARLCVPGGNVDYERFLREVLLPLDRGQTVVYQPFDCKTQTLKPPIEVQPHSLTIVEGSYSCHPALWEYYDMRIFLHVDPLEQLRRIALRNGDALEQFCSRWIPLEEKYFKDYRIRERCDFTIHTDMDV